MGQGRHVCCPDTVLLRPLSSAHLAVQRSSSPALSRVIVGGPRPCSALEALACRILLPGAHCHAPQSLKPLQPAPG